MWQVVAHTSNTGGVSSSTGAPAFAAAAGSGPLTPPVPLTAMYDESVKEQVAQGLHLSVAQATAQLQAEPTPDLRAVAKPQGLAQDQLYTLVLNALQMADDHMVSTDLWTQQQANDEMQYWKRQNQLSLINGVASWFLQH